MRVTFASNLLSIHVSIYMSLCTTCHTCPACHHVPVSRGSCHPLGYRIEYLEPYVTRDNRDKSVDSVSYGPLTPPRLRRFPGNLPTLRRRQRLRPRRATSLATHPGDVRQPFRGEVPCPRPSTLGSAELSEGDRVGVFLAWHGEATIVRYRTSGVLT